jgi:hypothetical protein
MLVVRVFPATPELDTPAQQRTEGPGDLLRGREDVGPRQQPGRQGVRPDQRQQRHHPEERAPGDDRTAYPRIVSMTALFSVTSFGSP